jgi:hypothetical protein
MNIFTIPIKEITYDNVISFCQQGVPEGINLDYKRDFPPSGLEKTISAFANTNGGVIIIGVEDEDSKPKPPFEGIDYKDKLEERVWNIIVGNIYPPVFPDIRVCPQVDNKTFVLIRIPQSNETPHAIFNNKKAYIRTGNRNKPEDLATMEQIEWLINRRKKSEEFREHLLARAKERYNNICKQKQISDQVVDFTLSITPLYPQKSLLTVEEIEDFVKQIKVKKKKGNDFPWIYKIESHPIQDGLIYPAYEEYYKIFKNYTEVNKFGLVFHKEEVEHFNSETKEKSLHVNQIFGILDECFAAIGILYNKVGYWGILEIKVSMNNLLGINFVYDLFQSREEAFHPIRFTNKKKNETETQLSWRIIASVSELNDPLAKQDKLLELIHNIIWSFGFKKSKDKIKELLQRQSK